MAFKKLHQHLIQRPLLDSECAFVRICDILGYQVRKNLTTNSVRS